MGFLYGLEDTQNKTVFSLSVPHAMVLGSLRFLGLVVKGNLCLAMTSFLMYRSPGVRTKWVLKAGVVLHLMFLE